MGNSKRESGGADGDWLVTYSDLMTLLLVFFVMLYVLTPGIDESTFNDIISHFQSSTSVVFENDEASKEDSNTELRKEWEEFKKALEEGDLSSQVSVRKIEDGVQITLSDSLTFNSGSANLLKPAKDVLQQIANIIGNDVRLVETQGHTDIVPISESSQYRSNWHLGAARAVSVVLFMKDASNIMAQKFEASSFGEYKPIASNETPEGRRKNRRVEIYVRYYDDQPAPVDTLNTTN